MLVYAGPSTSWGAVLRLAGLARRAPAAGAAGGAVYRHAGLYTVAITAITDAQTCILHPFGHPVLLDAIVTVKLHTHVCKQIAVSADMLVHKRCLQRP